MQITMLPLSDIKPYENNPRIHGVGIDAVAKSMREFGIRAPILVDNNRVVIYGHTRLQAAKQIGLVEYPCVIADDMTPEQARAYRIADNHVATHSDWDPDKLKLELDALKPFEFRELPLIEMAPIEFFPKTVNFEVGDKDPDELPTLPKPEIKTKLGDIYRLGRHRLMCGDSTSSEEVTMLTLHSNPIMMLTDPPYGVNLDQSWRDAALGDKALGEGNKNTIKNDDRADWHQAYNLFKGDICYVWHASNKTDIVKKNIEDAGFDIRQMIIWNKSIMVMGRSAYHWKHEPCWYAVRKGKTANWVGDRKQTTVWDAASPKHIMSGSTEEKTDHPSQKPVVLFEIPIINHTVETDSIYDPFGGSGSVLIAAEKTGRNSLTMEIDPAYCDLIITRWEKFTGQTAELIK